MSWLFVTPCTTAHQTSPSITNSQSLLKLKTFYTLLKKSFPRLWRSFPGGSVVKNLPAMQDTQVLSQGWEDPLEKEMVTHSMILAWEIQWTQAWQATVHGVTKESDTANKQQHEHDNDLLCFSFKNFVVLSFAFRNLSYLGLIFV